MAKRIRRTPEEARRVILDAAEAALATHGPAGIRLADVAKAAGVSHPTVLHHFGSRAGLLVALNRRTLEELRAVLVQSLAPSAAGAAEAIASTFAAWRGGLAQRLLWLMQEGAVQSPKAVPVFEEMVERLQHLRESLAGPGEAVDPYGSRALVHLITIAAFGDALIGPRLRHAETPDMEAAERQRFENWFADALTRLS